MEEPRGGGDVVGMQGRVRSLVAQLDAADPLASWEGRQADIREQIVATLGVPTPFAPVTPKMRVYRETDEGVYRQLYIGYEVEPGEEVRAHLLIPPRNRRMGNAAVLCLHGTSVEAKDTQLGYGNKPNRDYGRVLATHGFVTLAPDHVCAGERVVPGHQPYDTAPFYVRHPHWSAVGKAIWDGQRALDILCQLDEVEPQRIGAVGHSLGGHGSMFLAAFDERVRATVSSCGLTTWAGNPKRLNWARDSWYSYIPQLRPIFMSDAELPFDLHEFAALIAPRPFLNISGMTDPIYGNNEMLPEVGRQLHALYQLLGHGERFSHFLFGGGHEVPDYSMALTVAWLSEWLERV